MLARFFIAISSYPFDWRTTFGYFLATTYIFILLTYALLLISGIASFGIGCNLLAITVSKEIKGMIKKTNKKLKLKSERSLALSRFIDLIEWHSKCKKLSVESEIHLKVDKHHILSLCFTRLITNFSKFFKPLFMLAFSFSTITICSTMLLTQMAIV